MKIVDKIQEKLSRQKEDKSKVILEATNKDEELVMKSKDVISHVNQAIDVLKDLKKAAGGKGERFKYFYTYLVNFLSSNEGNTGFEPWVSKLESDAMNSGDGAENVADIRGDESDEFELDVDDEENESVDEDGEVLSEMVDKKGHKLEFAQLSEDLQNALKEFGFKSKISDIIVSQGDKSSFVKVFLDLDSLGKDHFKKFSEASVAPSWVSSFKDKVVLGFRAPKKKKKKVVEPPKEEVKKESVEEVSEGVLSKINGLIKSKTRE